MRYWRIFRWQTNGKRAIKLLKASVAAIKRFVRENPDAEVCCFFFDCDEPCYGHLSISLDTLDNNIRTSKELERIAMEAGRTSGVN